MVQTEQQYICIHQCLLAVLEGKENIVGPARVMDDNEGFEGTYSGSEYGSDFLYIDFAWCWAALVCKTNPRKDYPTSLSFC